ncbi:MAG TPA: hypothetical protein PLR41_04240 [Alphaproteobacteria bacterium]|nr:hypothetical protein [Alphaproteobacteria bacterium]
MKSKLRAFLFGVLAIAAEVALYYPGKLIDDQIDVLILQHLGRVAGWINWALHGLFWMAVIIGPLTAYLVGTTLLNRWRRKARFNASLAETARATVRIAGTKTWSAFHGDHVLALVVPDAIAAIDSKRRLLRLKAIGYPQDVAIEFTHIIGVTWQPGEIREAKGRQHLFRRFKPKYRTLAEHPNIRIEIATKGKEPVLEYVLHADPRDRRALERFYDALERGTRVERFTRPVPTDVLLNILPLQGSKYGYGWIEGA